MALIFVERSEKLSEKTSCDVNVVQVKKAGNSKQSFSISGLCGHKPGKNRQFVFKACKLWL